VPRMPLVSSRIPAAASIRHEPRRCLARSLCAGELDCPPTLGHTPDEAPVCTVGRCKLRRWRHSHCTCPCGVRMPSVDYSREAYAEGVERRYDEPQPACAAYTNSYRDRTVMTRPHTSPRPLRLAAKLADGRLPCGVSLHVRRLRLNSHSCLLLRPRWRQRPDACVPVSAEPTLVTAAADRAAAHHERLTGLQPC
jgi:hypothetical protein